jgi:tetrapyrrole methylase family protein/MazG family protein
MSDMILLGLGPGAPNQITREAWEILSGASEIWVRSSRDPSVAAIPSTVEIHSFDNALDGGEPSVADAALVVDKLISLGRRPQGVIYATPGNPLIDDALSNVILHRAGREGLRSRVVLGVSRLGSIAASLGTNIPDRLCICEAAILIAAHVPPFPPEMPALILHVSSATIASRLKSLLRTVYAEHHLVKLLHAGKEKETLEELPLSRIDESMRFGPITALFLPPLDAGTSLEALQEVVAHLRAPEGCPWDREQTHLSLRPHLLEEAYEVLSALDSQDPAAMREELGDLLLQIMLNAQIAGEHGTFTINDVSRGICDKLKRRHPHVFGDVRLEGVEGVLVNWEKLKERERDAKDAPGGLLEGVPAALPALGQAQEYQERASRVGFDWPEVQGVLDKIDEEIGEVRDATDARSLTDEVGDLFFALVNLSRWKGIDAESALRAANARFRKRFGFVEDGARRRGQRLSELTLNEMDALWEQAKALKG